MPIRKSLCQYIQGSTVLSLLGTESTGPHLPVAVWCPLCGDGWLDLCEDELFGGVWCFCRGCRFAGDLVELVARSWDMDIESTIDELARKGAFYPLDAIHRTPCSTTCVSTFSGGEDARPSPAWATMTSTPSHERPVISWAV